MRSFGTARGETGAEVMGKVSCVYMTILQTKDCIARGWFKICHDNTSVYIMQLPVPLQASQFCKECIMLGVERVSRGKRVRNFSFLFSNLTTALTT